MRKLAALVMALVALGVGAWAAPGPFIRVEQPWNTTLVLAAGLARPVLEAPIHSIKEGMIEGYVAKTNPFVLHGWWTLGVGGWVITDWFPHVSLGGGLRFMLRLEPTGATATAWAPYVGIGWWWGPFELFARLNWFDQVNWYAPLGGGYPSFGLTLDLDLLRKGAFKSESK